MIYSTSLLNVADNSGPTLVQCIKVLSGRRYAKIGDKLVVCIQKTGGHPKYKKGQILKAILIRSKKGIIRPNGTKYVFMDNAVVLLNAQFNLIGNRIKGAVPRELRKFHQLKILSLAKETI